MAVFPLFKKNGKKGIANTSLEERIGCKEPAPFDERRRCCWSTVMREEVHDTVTIRQGGQFFSSLPPILPSPCLTPSLPMVGCRLLASVPKRARYLRKLLGLLRWSRWTSSRSIHRQDVRTEKYSNASAVFRKKVYAGLFVRKVVVQHHLT